MVWPFWVWAVDNNGVCKTAAQQQMNLRIVLTVGQSIHTCHYCHCLVFIS